MNNEENKLGNNITALRKFYGKTQDELAYDLGIANNLLNMYEKGTRRPKKEVLYRIARYFRLTVVELECRDFTDIGEIDISKFLNKEISREFFECLYPIVYNDKCLENEKFRKAYQIQKEIREKIVNQMDYDDKKVKDFLELYKQANKEGIIEAAVNVISWNMYILSVMALTYPSLEDELFDFTELTEEQMVDLFLLNKKEKFLNLKDELSDFDFEITQELNEKNKEYENYIEKYKKDIQSKFIKNMIILKKSHEYSDLAYFYIAMRYRIGMYDNECTYEENRMIGDEMFEMLCSIKNKYALKLRELQIKYDSQKVNID